MTLTELINTTRFYLGNVDSTSYSDANITSALNRYYHKAIARAIVANGQWEVNGEVATTNIVAAQQEYTLTTPVPLLSLKRVEINLTGETNNWTVAEVIDMRNIPEALSNQDYINETRTYQVRLFDDSIFLINKPNIDVTNGLRIYYQTEASTLSTGTDVPNLIEEVQTYLINGACYDYCRSFDLTEKANRFKEDMLTDLSEIDRIYSNRLPGVRPQLRPHVESYR